MLISSESKRVDYISHLYIGKKHDFSILKEEFSPDINWFKNLKVRLDLGYTGFENYYNVKEIIIPKKKPKNKELSELDNVENKLKAKKRIKVEHCISGIKRYRILSIKSRIHDFNLYDDVLEVCAGLWNFYLAH